MFAVHLGTELQGHPLPIRYFDRAVHTAMVTPDIDGCDEPRVWQREDGTLGLAEEREGVRGTVVTGAGG